LRTSSSTTRTLSRVRCPPCSRSLRLFSRALPVCGLSSCSESLLDSFLDRLCRGVSKWTVRAVSLFTTAGGAGAGGGGEGEGARSARGAGPLTSASCRSLSEARSFCRRGRGVLALGSTLTAANRALLSIGFSSSSVSSTLAGCGCLWFSIVRVGRALPRGRVADTPARARPYFPGWAFRKAPVNVGTGRKLGSVTTARWVVGWQSRRA
jgi:hypothetical protein